MNEHMYRKNIYAGARVCIVQKQDQKSGKLVEGTVKKILTNKNVHTRGIKVLLENGKVGRVQKILS